MSVLSDLLNRYNHKKAKTKQYNDLGEQSDSIYSHLNRPYLTAWHFPLLHTCPRETHEYPSSTGVQDAHHSTFATVRKEHLPNSPTGKW